MEALMATTTDSEEPESAPTEDQLGLLVDTLAYARERQYVGWDYGDGMSSRVLRALPVENKWLNLVVQETIKRSPLNVRPLFRVEQRRNFKGTALFAMANVTAYELTGDESYLGEARALVDWLLEAYPKGYSGFCLTHPHDLQGLHRVVTAGTPGVVGTTYGVMALLRVAAYVDGPYGDVAETAADFVLQDLGYQEEEGIARINYRTADTGGHYTLNANALGARLLIDLYERTGKQELRDASRKILRYVASEQTDVGGWYYRDPPSASHLSMDSHHNGFIIESFQRYRAVTGSTAFDDVLETALQFYRDVLFEPSGAPNFEEDRAYPRDIHAAAQGILVFTYAGDLAFARRILEWTRANLYAGDGRFFFRQQRFYTKRHVLMRWCEAWMAYAISELCRAETSAPAGAPQR